jgi:hypothetical protein
VHVLNGATPEKLVNVSFSIAVFLKHIGNSGHP